MQRRRIAAGHGCEGVLELFGAVDRVAAPNVGAGERGKSGLQGSPSLARAGSSYSWCMLIVPCAGQAGCIEVVSAQVTALNARRALGRRSQRIGRRRRAIHTIDDASPRFL